MHKRMLESLNWAKSIIDISKILTIRVRFGVFVMCVTQKRHLESAVGHSFVNLSACYSELYIFRECPVMTKELNPPFQFNFAHNF